MASSKNRPAGMDSLNMNQPTPTEKSRTPKSEMGTVAKVAAGPVDSGKQRGVPGWPGKSGAGER